MDFSFSEEQQQLQDAISRFVQGDYSFERRKAIVASPEGWSKEVWQGLADLHDLRVPASARLGAAGAALPAIERALDIGLAALCAEALGVMEASVNATVEYLKTRQQFGQPIGRFQALRHRTAEMLLHLEQSRSMAYLAAMNGNLSTTRSAARRSRPPRSWSATPAASSASSQCSCTAAWA